MRHGIPRGERLEPDFCKLFGCFSGKGTGSFTPLINNSNESIPIGGQFSMRYKLPGSQGSIHHFPEACSEVEGLVCCVQSMRRMENFILTPEKRR